MTESNVGKWDDHYAGMETPLPYGTSSYEVIAEFMRGLPLVEDWGCGGGALRAYLEPGTEYVGVDGSRSPVAQVHADLVKYGSLAPGIVLRHVLEHNDHWQEVLHNAVASFVNRLIVVIFTPLSQTTQVMFREPDYGHVPVIAFRLGDLLAEIPLNVSVETIDSPDTAFGVETFLRVWR